MSRSTSNNRMRPPSSSSSLARRERKSDRLTFVLVHGAWHGAWCWTRVRDRLEAHGHRVYTPTLTGLADRSHLLSRDVTLDTHVADIENLFLWEEITDAVLVAHSFAGHPVSVVLDRIQVRVRALVLLDAFLLEDGQRPLDLVPEDRRLEFEREIAAGAIGRAPPPTSFLGIDSTEDRAWVEAKMTAQPYNTYTRSVTLSGGLEAVPRKSYARATRFPHTHLDAVQARLRLDASWSVVEMDAGHELMIDRPDEVSALLLSFE